MRTTAAIRTASFGFVLAASACRVDSGDPDASVAAVSQPITWDSTPGAAVDAFDRDDSFAPLFRTAARCGDCRVLHSAPLLLPETNISARSAKLMRPNGPVFSITIDPATGLELSEKSLRHARLKELEIFSHFFDLFQPIGAVDSK